MNGFSFHAEMPEERKSKSASKGNDAWTRATMRRYAAEGRNVNVCAVSTDRDLWYINGRALMKECISAVQDIPNSGVCGSSASRDYLDSRTVRIDEATARKLHPALFRALDSE